jgi:flagellar biosynthesis anti-sigma factor FlgM
MRIDRKPGTKRAEITRQGGESGSQQAPEEANELIRVSLERRTTDDYGDQARTSWLAAQAASPPEIRSERIAGIQRAIANGTYQVSAEQTAEAILSERQIRGVTAA